MKSPKYTCLPATQTPKVVNDKIIGWTLRMTLQQGEISHTHEIEYECELDEVQDVPGDVKLLEKIYDRLIEEGTFLEDTEAGLEAKLNAEV